MILAIFGVGGLVGALVGLAVLVVVAVFIIAVLRLWL